MVRMQIFHFSLITFHFFFLPLQPHFEKCACENGLRLSKEQALCVRLAPSLAAAYEKSTGLVAQLVRATDS